MLRRKPSGPILPSAHAIEREFKVIRALHAAEFPVPRPLILCEDPAIVGAPFYLMEMIDGRAFWSGGLPEVPRGDRAVIYEKLVATLARLHTLDPSAIGLKGYGRTDGYCARQVARWTRQYRASQTDDLHDVERLIDWLPTRIPQQEGVAIIHGDYRLDNVIYATDLSRVAAVIDWELSTLGDPLADFTYLALCWMTPSTLHDSGLADIDLASEGIPTLAEMTNLYCGITQRAQVPELNWYFAFNAFRMLGILQGVKRRALDGIASNAEAMTMGARVAPYAALGWSFACRHGARA